jgi:D-tyrosyl-tRNA(Tyr) deacylase
MKALVQRVAHASVAIEGSQHAAIGPGLLVLLGVTDTDTAEDAAWLASKVAGLRIMGDADGKMNLSVLDTGGEVMVISQFTLYGDARKGNRPSYIQAARPEQAEPLYRQFVAAMETALSKPVKTGVFGADMKVSLLNDGPVTLIVESK